MKKVIVGFVTFLMILLLIIIQNNFLNEFPLFGVYSNVGILFICVIGIVAGEYVGLAVGGVYGLLQDISFGRSLGESLVSFLIIGICAGYLKKMISLDNQLSLILIIVVLTFLFEIIQMLTFGLLYGFDFEILYFVKVVLLEIIYNIFIGYVFYKPFMLWGEVINRSRKGYYSLSNS